MAHFRTKILMECHTDHTTRRRMNRRKLAINGDKSNIPKRGTIWRIGARMGSVISWTIL